MARPGRAGAHQSRKAGPGGGALHFGRRPDLPGFGSAARDVGRVGLLQNPGIQARVRQRAITARAGRGPAVCKATCPSPPCAANTASILARYSLLLAVKTVPRRSSQLPLFARPQLKPHWTSLSCDVQQRIVRLVAQLLIQYRGTVTNMETTEDMRSE